jgi:hypothetical protein
MPARTNDTKITLNSRIFAIWKHREDAASTGRADRFLAGSPQTMTDCEKFHKGFLKKF